MVSPSEAVTIFRGSNIIATENRIKQKPSTE